MMTTTCGACVGSWFPVDEDPVGEESGEERGECVDLHGPRIARRRTDPAADTIPPWAAASRSSLPPRWSWPAPPGSSNGAPRPATRGWLGGAPRGRRRTGVRWSPRDAPTASGAARDPLEVRAAAAVLPPEDDALRVGVLLVAGDTQQPLAGYHVEALPAGTSPLISPGRRSPWVTDRDGRVAISDLDGDGPWDIHAWPVDWGARASTRGPNPRWVLRGSPDLTSGPASRWRSGPRSSTAADFRRGCGSRT